MVPIRLRGVHVEPVGEGFGHDGGEVAVEGCVLTGEGAEDGDGLLGVVADGVDVVDLAAGRGSQPPSLRPPSYSTSPPYQGWSGSVLPQRCRSR